MEEILRRSAKLSGEQLNALSPLMAMLPAEVGRELSLRRLENRKMGDEKSLALSKDLYGKGEALSRDKMSQQQEMRMKGLDVSRGITEADLASRVKLGTKSSDYGYNRALEDLSAAKKSAKITTGMAAAGIPIAGLAAYGTKKKEEQDSQKIIDALNRRNYSYYDLDV